MLQRFWHYMTSPEVGVVPRVVGHDVGVSRVHLLQVEGVQDGLLLRRLARLHRPDWERLVPALRLSGVDRRRRVLLLVLKEVQMHSKYFYSVFGLKIPSPPHKNKNKWRKLPSGGPV